MIIGNGAMWHGDCLDMMRHIPDGSVDMVLCDLPYGTTACKWDQVIPFEPLWSEYWRVCKPNAAVVLTASQPFTTALIMSQIERFRYEWIWDKKGTTGFQQAKIRPLKRHENICIFYKSQPIYNPQKEIRGKIRKKGGSKVDNGCYGDLRSSISENNEYYPTSICEISNAAKNGLIHPTQKPVALFEYLIKTYTNPGDLVLDNTSGSGTTAIAAQRNARRFICIERDAGYYYASLARVWKELQGAS